MGDVAPRRLRRAQDRDDRRHAVRVRADPPASSEGCDGADFCSGDGELLEDVLDITAIFDTGGSCAEAISQGVVDGVALC